MWITSIQRTKLDWLCTPYQICWLWRESTPWVWGSNIHCYAHYPWIQGWFGCWRSILLYIYDACTKFGMMTRRTKACLWGRRWCSRTSRIRRIGCDVKRSGHRSTAPRSSTMISTYTTKLKSMLYNRIHYYHIIHGEEVECSMVPQTNAVHDPRTMMIHLQRALPANWTVMSSRWFPLITLMTCLGILV